MNRIRARWWMDARWQDKLTGSNVSLDAVWMDITNLNFVRLALFLSVTPALISISPVAHCITTIIGELTNRCIRLKPRPAIFMGPGITESLQQFPKEATRPIKVAALYSFVKLKIGTAQKLITL